MIISISGHASINFVAVGCVEGSEAVGDFFRDMLRELAHSFVHLQRAARDVQRDVRAVDRSAQDHEIVGDEIFAVIGDEDAVAKEFDRSSGSSRIGV